MKYLIYLITLLLFGVTSIHLLAQAVTTSQTGSASDTELRELRRQIDTISARLAALEASPTVSSAGHSDSVPGDTSAGQTPSTTTATAAIVPGDKPDGDPFHSTTINFGVDGYYGYNFNAPIGRVNLLRAYDVSSNSFTINQATVMVEHLPTAGSRMGGRLDLQFGQATEALQGSAANEQRPQVWRNLFQAYGSYLAPVGSGLQIDFGKWASALGNEGNYTKDQIAYSRSYSFNYLPFYHMGVRATYNVTPKVGVIYWLINGANNTEDLNGFKSQAVLFTLKPASALTWNINYYFGQEGRDVASTTNPAAPTSPTQPGLPTTNINPAPNGRAHIFDSYATWNATPHLTLIGEADYVLNRTWKQQQPPRVVIGSLTARYALPRQWNLGARFEYLDDRGGLFSGTTQALKEGTVVLDRQFAPGFLARAEFRRDFSNQSFFLTDTAGALVHAQSTATLGLIYWWGTKQGNW